MKPRIVVVKTDNIGDAVLASGFFFELRKSFKKGEITAFLSPAGASVLQGTGAIDKIKVFESAWLKYKKTFFLSRISSALKLASEISKINPDILIGMRYKDRLSSLVISMAKAGKKYGYDVGGMGFGIGNKHVGIDVGLADPTHAHGQPFWILDSSDRGRLTPGAAAVGAVAGFNPAVIIGKHVASTSGISDISQQKRLAEEIATSVAEAINQHPFGRESERYPGR